MHPLNQFQMPASVRRAKRVTEPLDAAARARLAAAVPGSVNSSGSEHEAAALSSLVNEYLLETEATTAPPAADQDSDGDDDDGHRHRSTTSAATEEVVREIKDILDPTGGRSPDDDLRRRIEVDVTDAMQGLAGIRPNRPAFRRAVMSRLRDCGHDAGLCKAQWDKSSGVAAGSYEYIDVVVAASAGTTRLIVDVGFAAQFEVARRTPEYDAVHAVLPEVLVATAEDLRRVVRAASAAARRSLKSCGLSVPPWRKRRFMIAKWFGPYRRTVNAVPASAGAAAAMVGGGAGGNCRTILGFAVPPSTATTSDFWG
ncbi:hypothetical protein ACP4OV_013084 [Aristida adscensionis]